MTNTQSTDTRFLVADVVEILEASGWHRTWASCTNSVTDEMGTSVSLFFNPERDDSARVEFSYALPGVIENMYLDPTHGAARIAKIILAASDAPED